MNISNKLNHC